MVIFYYSDLHILQKKMKKINVGIIGRNFGYKVIYKALKNIKGFNVLGFSVKNISNKLLPENIKIFKNWKSLVSDEKIKVVFICSPPSTHKKIILYSIKKNKHIYCEKPVCKSFKEISNIYEKLRNKKLIHFVNYEFNKIDAFQEFKKKYIPKIKINNVNICWLIKIPTKGRSRWKNNHSLGGGNFYNYICHILFYLEDFFGKVEIKDSKLIEKKNKFELVTNLYSTNNKMNINLVFKTIDKNSKLQPYHKISFCSNKGNYILFSKTNNLYDQFIIKKNKKVLFKPSKINFDFRINPTYQNILSFKKDIYKKKNGKLNFIVAKRIHLLINRIRTFQKK